MSPSEAFLFLKQLTDISSESSNLAGVLQVQKLTEQKLKKIGFDTYLKENPIKNTSAPLLIGEIERGTSKFVTLVTHADTVFPKFGNKKVSGDTYSESGAIDCKGGTVVLLSGLTKFLSLKKLPFSIRVVSAPSEELGSHGFLDFFKELSKDSSMVLGFEPALDNGNIIQKRRGNLWYDIEVTGVEAHSGRSHKDGINAAHDLCAKLAEIQKHNNYSKDITINIGHIEGGKDKYNVVCGWAKAKLDIRFPDWETRKEIKTKVESILKKVVTVSANSKKPAVVKFEIANDCPPLFPDPASKENLTKYLACLKKATGKAYKAEQAGGAADINYFSRPGLCLIDGLGPMGGGMHSKNEFITISSLESRARALTLFLEAIKN